MYLVFRKTMSLTIAAMNRDTERLCKRKRSQAAMKAEKPRDYWRYSSPKKKSANLKECRWYPTASKKEKGLPKQLQRDVIACGEVRAPQQVAHLLQPTRPWLGSPLSASKLTTSGHWDLDQARLRRNQRWTCVHYKWYAPLWICLIVICNLFYHDRKCSQPRRTLPRGEGRSLEKGRFKNRVHLLMRCKTTVKIWNLSKSR